jgi:hypothetical protein
MAWSGMSDVSLCFKGTAATEIYTFTSSPVEPLTCT